jgi:uncharacterized RDD family membrane protein YckC
LSYVVDVIVLALTYAVGVAAVRFLLDHVFDVSVPDDGSIAWYIAGAAWYLVYYWYSWAVDGKTPGQVVLGLRVVTRNGDDIGTGRALVRVVFFVISTAVFWLGFVPVLFDKRRRALHDFVARTVVVYDWDARAARLRLLARRGT